MARAFLFAFLMGCVLAGAQTVSPDQRKEDVEQLEREVVQANFDCNYDLFRRVEGDEFLFTDPQGNVITRADDLAGEKDCKKREATFELSDIHVNVYGDTAVFNARLAIHRTKEGQPVTTNSRFTDVLVWRDGRWQLVAGHASRIGN
jgi:hypothetical protein